MGKGADTRERILEEALRLARRDGLEGLTIGALATETGLSKSGLFAHFGSKESLQIEVLEATSLRFTEEVLRPAFRAPRGIARIEALVERWMEWVGRRGAGGCVLLAASMELDDRPGAPRDHLVKRMRELQESLARAARIAIEEKQLRAELDPEQFAFELHGLMLGYHLSRRLLRRVDAEVRTRAAFKRLLAAARSPRA